MKYFASLLCLLPFILCSLLRADPLSPAVTSDDVNWAASRLLASDEVRALSEAEGSRLLGFTETNTSGRRRVIRPKEEVVRVLLVFNQPVHIGTVLGASADLSVLKPDGSIPDDSTLADVGTGDDWQTVPVQPGQSVPGFAPLPPANKTRALVITTKLPRTDEGKVRLLSARLANLTPLATANADAEFTSEPYLSAPYHYDAGHITRGHGTWINSGKNAGGINSRAPISDVAPSWFVLSWPDARRIDGVLLQDNFNRFDLQVFDGPAGINAAAATEDEWKTLTQTTMKTEGGHRWITFDPIETRALRLRITKTSEGPVAKLSGFHAFSDLLAQPALIVPPATRAAPPVAIAYDLANAGKVTVVIDGPDGTRVRNLVANVTQEAGTNRIAWDLKNEDGTMVEPGKYQWKAITHPPLKLRYELTAYPNVHSLFPDRTAWLNGHNGAGGWLADHTAPAAAASTGDRLFFGAPVAESGVSIAETDLDGRKVWGLHSFAAFTGTRMLATDGKTLFSTTTAANFGKTAMEKSTEGVWAVDLETRKVRTVALLQPTADRKRGIQGFAARDDKVYLAIRAGDNWIDNAVAAVDVDLAASLPLYPPARSARAAHEVVADSRTDFLRLLRLRDSPPGLGNLGLTWLESTNNIGPRQHIVVAFKKPVTIGSLVFPPPAKEDQVQFQISVLRAQAPYPPRPDVKADWEIVPLTDNAAWAVQALPEGTTTRAIRLSFIKGGEGAGGSDDILGEVENQNSGPSLDSFDLSTGPKKVGLGSASDRDPWMRRIEGMKLLSRRYENVASSATVKVNSGEISEDGTWDAKRTEPLSEASPAIYALEWKQPQKLRGLAIKEIDSAQTEIDVYTGPANAPIDIQADADWENLATYQQKLRYYYQPDPLNNTQARYMDGYVDFSREVSTRAVRLRIVKQWDTKEGRGWGVRKDRGGQELDLRRCHVYGVAALKYLGGEAEPDPLTVQRLEVLDAASGKIVKEVPLAKAGEPRGQGNTLAFNATGDLFAISDHKLVRIDLEHGNHQVLVDDLIEPTALACDPSGNFLIFDAAQERKTIRVYDPQGKFLRMVGEPGGYEVGPWNSLRMDRVIALASDSRGQIWAVEQRYWPKRVSMWSNDGTFLKEILGPTEYGGGGAIDPGDPNRLFYGPLEFELDWKTGTTRLKNLMSLTSGMEIGDRPVRINNRLYLHNVRPGGSTRTDIGLVYLHENNRVRIVAAIGEASKCKQLLDPALLKAFNGKAMTNYMCVWSDLNGDEKAQPNEIQLWPLNGKRIPGVMFDNQLGAQIGSIGFRITKWLPNGVPVYERFDTPQLWAGQTLRLDNGNFYHREDDSHESRIAVQRPDGSVLWTYRTEGPGVHALTKSSPIHPGQIVCELGLAGHVSATEGDLGEFMVFNTNTGVMNIITADGLFAGQIFRDLRERGIAQPWSQPDATRGASLDNQTLGQEHFGAYFTRTKEGKYYAVVGHNHASVVEVDGMDRFKRFSGELTIGTEDVVKTRDWEQAKAIENVYARAPVIDCHRVTAPPKLDGLLDDWPKTANAQIDNGATFHMGYDDTYLYLAYKITGRGPLKNNGGQWDRLFKSGASVDLQISTDPDAPADRKIPVKGDQRLLMTFMGDEPAAVLYQAVVPDTPESQTWQVVSPVGAATFDRVVQLKHPRLFSRVVDSGYVLEAAIPLAELGLEITPGLRVKMDWGVLTSGPDGTEVLQREYWANKFTQITADAPSEAVLHPNLWGHVRFHGGTVNAHMDPTRTKADPDIEDMLNELK